MQSYGVASRTAVIPGRLPHRTEEFASRNSFRMIAASGGQRPLRVLLVVGLILDVPEDELTGIHCEVGKTLTVELANVTQFRSRCPEQYSALLLECAAQDGLLHPGSEHVLRVCPAIVAPGFATE